MPIDRDLFVSLLYREESEYLDFKEGQYKLAGASNQDKEELLKDILAFANAWRSVDAFILRGVREVKGGPSVVTGVDHHLEDAHLQQFVSGKTHRPIAFSYVPFEYEGKRVGIIRIALQKRPNYLKNNFGSLNANTVYLRRGSSTAIASPDEIAEMGRQPYSPLHLARDQHLLEKARTLSLHSSLLELSDEALSLIVGHQAGWEYRLFACRLREEIDLRSDLKVEMQVGLPSKSVYHLDDDEIPAWQKPKLTALRHLITALEKLINETFKVAVGAPGEPGDPCKINTVARNLGELYERALQWSIDTRSVSVSEGSERFIVLLSRSGTSLTESIEELATQIDSEISRVESIPKEEQSQATAQVFITLDDPFPTELHAEIQKLGRRISSPDPEKSSGFSSGCLLAIGALLILWVLA